ncbi:MAG: ABC transporter substrate-binding protein [Chloroflexota bacterium]
MKILVVGDDRDLTERTSSPRGEVMTTLHLKTKLMMARLAALAGRAPWTNRAALLTSACGAGLLVLACGAGAPSASIVLPPSPVSTPAGSHAGASVGQASQGRSASAAQPLAKLTLQLDWTTQAEFAGYYVALAKGFYKRQGLDVTITPGGPAIQAEKVVASGQAQLGVDWIPPLLSARDHGAPLISIAQIFQSSAMRQISFKSAHINSPADLRGKTIANWLDGEQYELYALLAKYGIDRTKDVHIVKEGPDMTQFLGKLVDSASAMTYNELNLVREQGVKDSQLNIIDFNKEGVGMLEDNVFTTEQWLSDAHNKELAARFVAATIQGWRYAEAHQAEAVSLVLKADKTGTAERNHQSLQMKAVAKLVGPPNEIGLQNDALLKQTANLLLKSGGITKPAGSFYTKHVYAAAQALLGQGTH